MSHVKHCLTNMSNKQYLFIETNDKQNIMAGEYYKNINFTDPN